MVCCGVTTKEFCHCSVNTISKLNNMFLFVGGGWGEIWISMLLITLNLVINVSFQRFNKEYRDVHPHPL